MVCEKINKIDKLLPGLTKKKGRGPQWNERGDTIRYITEIQIDLRDWLLWTITHQQIGELKRNG